MRLFTILLFILISSAVVFGQGTRLLRQPSISDTHITFTYGSDVWVAKRDGSNVVRITSTPAVESDPVLSPDGNTIAFTSNRSGNYAVYTVPIQGGMPERITWHPAPSFVRGWSADGSQIYYVSNRDYAPVASNRLWKIPAEGGVPQMVIKQRVYDVAFSPDESKMLVEQVSRWDDEWRNYRGGQNKPLFIVDLDDLSETIIKNELTTDRYPVWLTSGVYFLSDRDGVMNIWSYDAEAEEVKQLTTFEGSDIKCLSGKGNSLTYERDGYLHIMDLGDNSTRQLEINIVADFPWASVQWENVGSRARFPSISPNGKRIVVEARGDIFTVPVEYGSVRNLTQSSDVADRRPLWSPKGDQIAYFTDEGKQPYRIKFVSQDGMETIKEIGIGESKLAWEPTWSPDGKYIAFTDDDLRVRIVDIENSSIKTVGLGGVNIERGSMGLTWSPDSKWLAYSKSATNNFRQIMIWSSEDDEVIPLTNTFADAFSPAWDQDMKHFYFLASTDVALGATWANTSAMNSNPEYAAYVINLDKEDLSPFKLRSDEEEVKEEKEESDDDKKEEEKPKEDKSVKIDFENIERRIIALPIPVRNYVAVMAASKGSVLIAERVPNQGGLTINKFTLEDRESKEFLTNVSQVVVSTDGKNILVNQRGSWKVLGTAGSGSDGKSIQMNLQKKLDRVTEWYQIFNEAWRYEKDYFYDPDLHGRDWDVVYERYAPLIPYVRHRADLTYVLDMMNGELSVGHSFVRGADYPDVESSKIGLLGADFEAENSRWKIDRIYTTENWNPELTSPLDQPGINIKEGYYLVGINGTELTSGDNLFQHLDGTLNQQTVLHINDEPSFEDSWTETIQPIYSESALRQRAWVEDNRRMVDELSDGKLAYVWVPNTSGNGLVSFNRYFFAQQDKLGAVIDERYNGGGLLDDYMVDLMTRTLRAAYTNEIPGAKPKPLPGGVLGPKVLLVNEMAGSGGDFFPWAFRQQNAGPLIGQTTWGGLVKSSTHYSMIDGSSLTSPDNAIFDPVKNEWIAENKGIVPDIEVRQTTDALEEGRDPQLERAVEELMDKLDEDLLDFDRPTFSTPAIIED